jgi:hypothetical protein
MSGLFRILSLITLLLACGSSTSYWTILPTLRPTPSMPPRTTEDTVVTLALRQVALHGLVDFGPRPQVILLTDHYQPEPSGLPAIDSVHFVLLDSLQIQQIADTTGDMNVLVIQPPSIWPDSATVVIGNRRILQSRARRIGLMVGFSTCSWHLNRLPTGWRLDSLSLCLAS